MNEEPFLKITTWDEPGTIIEEGEFYNLPYLILVGPFGSLNGYVGVPVNHPWYELEYSTNYCEHLNCYEHTPEHDIEVHGGLTFSGTFSNIIPSRQDVWWFGFDCSHYLDYVPVFGHMSGNEVFRDKDYVKNECQKLAEQLSEIEKAKK